MKEISLKTTLELLQSGNYVKINDDTGYDADTRNSIQEYWEITKAETKKLLSHPLLKGFRIKLKSFVIVDDLTPVELNDNIESENDFIPFEVVQTTRQLSEHESHAIAIAQDESVLDEAIEIII